MPHQLLEAKRLNEQMVKKALALEGTCTGEHGVGVGKIKYLEGKLGRRGRTRRGRGGGGGGGGGKMTSIISPA